MFKNRLYEPFYPPHPFCLIFLLTLFSIVLHLNNIVPIWIIAMPTKKTRINLSVDDDMNELLTALSKFEGKPKATLITDILEQMRPHLTDLLHAMELVEQKKDPSKVLNKLLVGQQRDFLDRLEVSDD